MAFSASPGPPPPRGGGAADVIAVLVLVEVAAGLLAAIGQAVFMASPIYLLVPALKAVLLLVLSGQLARAQRWALIAMMAVQALALAGFWLGLAAGMTPWLAGSVTLSGLLTEVGVPLAIGWLCARIMLDPTSKLGAPPTLVVSTGRRVRATHAAEAVAG
jgi:hypothetical protein